MTGSEVADRVAITDLIARYAVLVDTAQWQAVGDLFTADARIDFSAFGAPVMAPAELVEFLARSLGIFRRTQHHMGLPVIDLDDGTARARTSCLNPMVIGGEGAAATVWLIGLWYDDELVRTASGWRFTARTQDRCYTVTDLPDTVLA